MDQHSCTSSTLIIDWQAIYRSRTNHTGIFAKACLRGQSYRGWVFNQLAHTVISNIRGSCYTVVKLYLLVCELYCVFEPLMHHKLCDTITPNFSHSGCDKAKEHNCFLTGWKLSVIVIFLTRFILSFAKGLCCMILLLGITMYKSMPSFSIFFYPFTPLEGSKCEFTNPCI